jgi:hypothetical protein
MSELAPPPQSEAQVREVSLVRTTSMRRAMTFLRSTVDTAANKATFEEHRRRTRGGNQHMSGGIEGKR